MSSQSRATRENQRKLYDERLRARQNVLEKRRDYRIVQQGHAQQDANDRNLAWFLPRGRQRHGHQTQNSGGEAAARFH